MSDLNWGDEIADYLIAAGVVQDGPTATGNTTPPIWIPQEGAEEPDLLHDPNQPNIVSLIVGPEIPGEWHTGFMQERAIELRVRSKVEREAEMLHRVIRGLMEEKKHLLMGEMLVQQSKLWRGVQRIAVDDNSVTLTQSFRVAVRIADLTV